MKKMASTKDAAKEIGVTPCRVRQLCGQGRVLGAELIAGRWIVPMPIEILPAKPSRRRPGKVSEHTPLSDFLSRRLPRKTPGEV